MATRVIDDTKLQNIAVAIQSKDNGGQMTVDEMPGRIEPLRNDFELLKTVILDEEVSTIKVDLDEHYNEFLFIPEIFIGNTEWVYASGLDTNNEVDFLGLIFSTRIEDYWSFAQYGASFAFFLSPLRFCVFNGNSSDNGAHSSIPSERNFKSIIFRLYNNSSSFRSGSYKLYGRKDGGKINAN